MVKCSGVREMGWDDWGTGAQIIGVFFGKWEWVELECGFVGSQSGEQLTVRLGIDQ